MATRNFTQKEGEAVVHADVWGVTRFNAEQAKELDKRAAAAKLTPSQFLGGLMAITFAALEPLPKVAEKPAEKPAEQPAETPAEQPEQKPAEQPKAKKRNGRKAKAA